MNNNRGNNRRRGRGNNRVQGGGGGGGGQQINRIDSRARGNAPQMLEKYRKMAQDAHLNGDRVQAEYFLQFADHYFRVIADTRVRQEEQRLRHNGGGQIVPGNGGVSGDRWQDQDGDDDSFDFAADNEFPPAFDQRPQQARREEREPRPERNDARSDNRNDARGDNRNDGRNDGRNEGRGEARNEGRGEWSNERRPRAAEPVIEEPTRGEGVRIVEGEPVIDASDNPFVRENRGTRGRGPRGEPRGEPRLEPRRARRPETPPLGRTLDPSSLPPALGIRAEPDVAEPSAPANTAPIPTAPIAAPVVPASQPEASTPETAVVPVPKKRGRPRKNPLPEVVPVPSEG